MLKLSIKSAINLPSPTKKPLKYQVVIYGINFVFFYLGETQFSKEKTRNPVFNADFLLDIFRIGHKLKLVINGKTFLVPKIFIGNAIIDLSQLSPNIAFGQLRIPISQQLSQIQAELEVEYEFQNMIYRSIPFNSHIQSVLYIFITYNSPVTDFSHLPVEIQCLHPFINYYYLLHEKSCWESIGYCSEQFKWINMPSGPTQVIRINPSNFKHHSFYFILKSNTYTGSLFFNFLLCEQEEEYLINFVPIFKPTESDHKSLFSSIPIDISQGQSVLTPLKVSNDIRDELVVFSIPLISQLPDEDISQFYNRVTSSREVGKKRIEYLSNQSNYSFYYQDNSTTSWYSSYEFNPNYWRRNFYTR